MFFFWNDKATTENDTYGHTLSLHDALPICQRGRGRDAEPVADPAAAQQRPASLDAQTTWRCPMSANAHLRTLPPEFRPEGPLQRHNSAISERPWEIGRAHV